ncbi:MAG: AAA family ATPase, partial [Chloroflexi bacterium]|nr:AAA family ATPase [Chloroflexota bacterium]
MFIEEVYLASFRGFRNFHLKCSPITVMVGVNSGGKTSVLQAIHFLHDIFRFAFGNGEAAEFSAIQWVADPTAQNQRINSGDP